jgi:ABC-type antimicrobial peptide transport system permease subunit
MSFVINTTLPESTVKASAEKALHEMDKDLPIENFESMEAYLDTTLSARKLSLFLLSIFAAIGIILTATGVYGAVSDSVIRRRHEIAIRMALGATPSRAIILVTRLGLLATAAGIVIGSAIVVTLTRLLTSLLYGVSAFDPVVHLSNAAILTLLAIVASAIPAARLLRFNIREILRP